MRSFSRSSRFCRGFTLLELLVVLAIMGMAVGLVMGTRSPGPTSADARMAAEALAAGLREARSQAIMQGRPVVLQIDIAARRFGIGRSPDRDLPRGLNLTVLTGRADVTAAQRGGIRFFPDGSSTGGRVTVESGARQIVVGVDWLSGRVTIADRS